MQSGGFGQVGDDAVDLGHGVGGELPLGGLGRRVGRAVARVTGHGEAVYRDWMLTSGQYVALAEALAKGRVVLRTNPDQYRRAKKHYWHEAMFIPELGDDAAAWAVAARFQQLREDDFSGTPRCSRRSQRHRRGSTPHR
jgi:hypothetical protein